MKNKFLPIFLVLLIVAALTGCATTTTHYLGAQADQKGVARLAQESASQQVWKDLYVRVDYSYQRSGTSFKVDGILSFTDSSIINYERVRDLKLKLFFLDSDLRVVKYLDVCRTLGTNIEDKWEFHDVVDIPAAVTALTFGYDGLLTNDEPGSHQIWNLPKRNK